MVGLLAGALVIVVAVYWETAVSTAAIWWRSNTYAHGMLIFPISAYLVWRRRSLLQSRAPRPSLWGLATIAALAAMWLVGQSADALVVQQLALVAMVPGVVWALLGTWHVRVMAFPLAYLIFAVPMGEALVPTLQDITAIFSVQGLRLSGIPVLWEGRYISTPTGDFRVSEACSGVRYLIASLALGCLYAYLSYRSPWRRITFVAAALVVPIVANGIRAYLIILLAHMTNMRLAVGVDHVIYGWLFFGLVIFILFWIGSFWREASGGQFHDPRGDGGRALGPGAPGGRVVVAAGAAVALAASGPVAASWALRSGPPAVEARVELPAPGGAWRGPSPAEPRWRPDFSSADQVVRRAYRGPEGTVEVLIVHYNWERQGRELISSQHRVDGDERWRRLADGRRHIELSDGSRFAVQETLMSSEADHLLVWHWYDIGGHVTADDTRAKLWGAWSRLIGGRPGATLVALATSYGVRPDDARPVLRDLLMEAPELTDPGGVLNRKEAHQP